MKIQIPEKLEFLFHPARYKVAYGGRGSAKSWSVADALLVLSSSKRVRVLCCREIQDSIKESSHRLLKEQIERLGMSKIFNVTDRSISCTLTGSEFIFEGLFRNVNRIKSLEGIDICWVEEAEKVTGDSWDILIPTIRKEGSEIWVTFNPQFEDDDTYQRFVAMPPDGARVVKVNYYDNPWFPAVLQAELEQDKQRDFAKYETVWLGKPKGSGRKIWTAFDKDVHVKEISLDYIAEHGNCYMAMDPHSHYYPFCVWVAILPKNKRGKWPEDYYKHVYAEWPGIGDLQAPYHEIRQKVTYKGSILDMAKEIQVRDGMTQGIVVRSRFMDTRFAKGSGSAGLTTSEGIVEQFAKRENGGLMFQLPKEMRIDAQRVAIHSDMLWNTTMERGSFNEPTFSVSPACKNVILSLQNHRLEEDREKESEKYKDASDALRICWSGFENMEYVDPHETHVSITPSAFDLGQVMR